MAVKIRLRRVGAKKAPFYRVVVADSRFPRDGRFIEEIGTYDPNKEPSEVKIDAEKAKQWTLKRGWKVVQGAVQSLTAEEYARLEKTHPCCTVAAVSDNREPLLPHWHVEGR